MPGRALLCALLCLSAAAYAGEIAGTCRDDQGRPVAAVHLYLQDIEPFREPGTEAFVRELTTGADGSFRFIDVPAGLYRITPTSPNFAGDGEQAELVTSKQRTVVALTMRPKAIVRGKVTVPDGRLLEGATLACLIARGGRIIGASAPLAVDGSFEARFDAEGDWTLRVRLPGYDFTQSPVTLDRQKPAEGLTLDLAKPTATVTVQVVGRDGKTPAPQAEVRWEAPWSGIAVRDWQPAPDGVLQIPDVPAGLLSVSAQGRGYQGRSQNLTIAGQDLTARVVLDGPAVILRGTILGADGKPATDTEVPLRLTEGDGDTGRLSGLDLRSDGQGRYELDHVLSPGRYSLSGRDLAEPVAVDVRTWKAYDNINLRLKPAPAGTLTGRILSPRGVPVAGAMVAARAAGNLGGTRADDSGAYSLKLPAGEYRVVAAGAGWAPSAASAVQVKPDETATCDLTLRRGAALTVSATTSDSLPAEAVRVAVEPGNLGVEPDGTDGALMAPGLDIVGGWRSWTRSARFAFSGLSEGQWTVSAQADGYADAEQTLALTAGSSRSVQLSLVRLRTLTLQIQAPDGTPLADREVLVGFNRGGQPSYAPPTMQTVRTDAEGNALCPDTPGDARGLWVESEVGARRGQPLQAASKDCWVVPVKLERGVTVHGVVYGRDVQLPVDGMSVALTRSTIPPDLAAMQKRYRDAAGNVDWRVYREIPLAPGQTTFEVPGLLMSEANWFVHLVAPGVAAAPVMLPKTASGVVPVDLVARRPGGFSGTVTDAYGEPLPGTRLVGYCTDLYRAGVDVSSQPLAVTDDQGRFQAQGLYPGAWRINTYRDGYCRETRTVFVGEWGGEEECRFVLRTGGTITGSLKTKAGTPPARGKYYVYVYNAADERTTYGYPKDDGSFTIPNVYPGAYTVAVYANGRGATGLSWGAVAVTDDKIVDLGEKTVPE
jgi:protocatechuate 3,4-dioxygenase beta subunit